MYFKITRNNLKKAIVSLSSRIDALSKDETWKNTNLLEELKEYHEQVEFALYKTKLNEFYIDYNFAKQIRSALMTEEK